MKTAVIELHYLPCLDYFKVLMNYDKVLLEAHETFQKQTYRNRCYTLQTNKTMLLSVPVQGGAQRLPIAEVALDKSSAWATFHWRSIRSTYGKTPFFEFYADAFQAVFTDPPPTLFALNHKLLTICLDFLQLSTRIELTSSFKKTYAEADDLREWVHPKKADRFSYPDYWQPFGNTFVPNLAILDLLFCTGSEARKILLEAKPNKY